MEGGVGAALLDTTSAGSGRSAGSVDEFEIAYFICVFTAKNARTSLRRNVFFDFFIPSHLKHLCSKVFLEDGLPEMLSKLGVLAERGIKKSKKHHAIAPAALGGCGGLGQLWEALAELWDPTLDPTLDPTSGSIPPSRGVRFSSKAMEQLFFYSEMLL